MIQHLCQFEILRQQQKKCFFQSAVLSLSNEPQNNKETQKKNIKAKQNKIIKTKSNHPFKQF